ncbi:amidohydrolase family protein [Rhodococcus sp. ARC_M6]|uniref:amidohydrolase family protein n=1 Tax=Rhodococcus sp. ARC_M6 TaxID=2928852 RepID=UPI0027E105A5|nr:amidohydrolase family protein [Rhodococcus sp. ARC_M6]
MVTQPGFIADRGDDYLEHVDPTDIGGLYRCRTLLSSSVPVAFSSDAPYGPLSPWAVIAAAQERQTPRGVVLGGTEAIGYAQALEAYLSSPGDPGGTPRRVQIGRRAGRSHCCFPRARANCHRHQRQTSPLTWRSNPPNRFGEVPGSPIRVRLPEGTLIARSTVVHLHFRASSLAT